MVLPRQVIVFVMIIVQLLPGVVLFLLLVLVISEALVLETELRGGL